MAETVHLYLKLNGTEIEGESSQMTLGREDSIECFSWAWGAEKTSGSSGPTTMGEIRFVQTIDKATPLLFKGLIQSEVAEGDFKFFRSNPSGDGTTEQFFTVRGEAGRVTSISEWVADTNNPATATLPPLLQVTMLFGTIKNTYESTGTEFEWEASFGK